MTGRFRHLWEEADQPTAAVVERLAPLVVAASRPFADWYFGEPDVAAEIVQDWMTRPTSEVFAGRAIVFEDGDGALGGCIIALAGGELTGCRLADFAAFCEELGPGPDANEVAAASLAVSQELFPSVADDDVYVSRVGVDPRRRGQGIGRALVNHAMEVFGGGRDGGRRRCRLDVSADNHAAIRAYEAAGLRIATTSHSPAAGLTYCAMCSPD